MPSKSPTFLLREDVTLKNVTPLQLVAMSMGRKSMMLINVPKEDFCPALITLTECPGIRVGLPNGLER